MRDGMQAIMRQIDESLGNQPEKTGVARWRPKSSPRLGQNAAVPAASNNPAQG